MNDELRKVLLDIGYRQDSLMHQTSGELGVKTSLYLVFAAFIFSAGLSVVQMTYDKMTVSSRFVLFLSAVSLASSLLGAVCLLLAAWVRDYEVLPRIEQLIGFAYSLAEPNQLRELEEGILFDLDRVVMHNKERNEKKSTWITRGACFLLISTAALVFSSGRMLYLLIRPS